MEPRSPSGTPAQSLRTVDRATARREELLAGLLELFLAEGFLRFGVGELAERMRCSRTTLYSLAPTKEQLVVKVVRSWFKEGAVSIEAAVAASDDPVVRIERYLGAVSATLEPASTRFRADLAEFAPAAEIYRRNTEVAVERVRTLVTEGVEAGALRAVDAVFVGAVAARVMTGIQGGEIGAATGLDDAAAYEHLADLLLNGLRIAPTVQ